jgi:2,3-di-O-geranylgeranylglyceryl phosphate reductase (EC 1.3.99.-)
MAFSPDKEQQIPFDGDGFMLNRTELPRIQNEEIVKNGN